MQTARYHFSFIFLLCVLAPSCSGKLQERLNENYQEAIANEGTFRYFTVVKVKNMNTGEVREVSMKGNFLRGALHRDLSLGYNSASIKKINQLLAENKNRYFEFSNPEALYNISFNRYSVQELDSLETRVNFDSLAHVIEREGEWRMEIPNDDHKIMAMYAHALYNRGILTGENSCRGGALRYESPRRIAEMKAILEQQEKWEAHEK